MLLFAANEGHLDIIEYLLKLKVDVNEVTRVSSQNFNLNSKERLPFCELCILISWKL
jgi:hypothetical protein